MLLRLRARAGEIEGEQPLEDLLVAEVGRPAVGGEDRGVEPTVGVVLAVERQGRLRSSALSHLGRAVQPASRRHSHISIRLPPHFGH